MPSKNMYNLNNGWPISEKPLLRDMRFEIRDARVYAVCTCGQAIFCLTEPPEVAADPQHPEPYTVTLEFMRSRVADHWLRCHEEEIRPETYW